MRRPAEAVRDRRLIAVFAAIALLASSVVGAHIALGELPAVQAISRDVPLGPDATLSVQFVGDTYLGDEAQPRMDRWGYDWPLAVIRPALRADFVVANAEGPMSLLTQSWNPAKKFSHSSRPEVAGALARAGIDALTVGNNHALDTGPVGLADTLRHAEAAGLATFGAGLDLARAEQPLLLRSEAGTIGIVSLGESFGFKAGIDAAGTVVLSPETVQRGADLARSAGADWVIAAVHWGDNYAPINDSQRHWAQQFANAGYDMVIGHGPHIAQPIEVIGSMPVFYSLGNFAFETPGRYQQFGVPGFGLMVEVELGRDSTPRLSVQCLMTDNSVVAYQPRLCDLAAAQSFLPTLHPSLTLDGDRGLVPCSCFVPRDPP